MNIWTTQGPDAGRIDQIHIDPVVRSNIYAVLPYGGIFKSIDSGLTWRAANRGINPANLSDIAIDPVSPSTLYAGTYGLGLFKSEDGAESWCEMNSGLSDLTIVSIAIDPLSPTTLYVGTAAGVFKSTDGGKTWAGASAGLTGTGVEAIAIDGRNSAVLYAANSAGMFRSETAAASWNFAGSGIATGVNVIRIDPEDSATLYAGSFGGGVFKTVNSGVTWTPINTGLTDLYIDGLVIDPRAPAHLFVATGFGLESGLFTTTNGGEQWVKVETGLSSAAEAVAIDPVSSLTVYGGLTLGAFQGVFARSLDGGKSWSQSTLGLSGALVYEIVAHPSSPLTAYAATFQRIFRTMDGGRSWSPRGSLPASGRLLLSHPSSVDVVYAGTLGGVFKSIDGGQSWTALNNGLTDLKINALAWDRRAKTIYAGTDSGVFKTLNGGGTWNPTGFGETLGVLSLAVDPDHPRTAYAASFDRLLFRTSDGGASWKPLPTLGGQVTSIVIDPSETSRLYALVDTRGVFRSEDSGGSWVAANQGIPFVDFVWTIAMDRQDPKKLYVSQFGTPFRTADRGNSWTPFSEGLNWASQVLSLDVSSTGKVVYGGTFGGAFEHEIRPYRFHTLTPCRLLDTRDSPGSNGGPALESNSRRTFPVAGRCGVPLTARSLALSISVTAQSAGGHLTVYETGTPTPDTFSVSYSAGRTRANNAIVGLDPLGRVTVKCSQDSGTVHFIADVTGYFE